jgi:hypothetical protein
MSHLFPALDRQAGADSLPSSAAEPGDKGDTSPPVFRDIAAVRLEIQAVVSAIKVPPTLTNPHPIVARLLKQDATREPKRFANGYVSDFYGPKFATPIQQRRLRILSCILTELDRLGCEANGSTHAGERFSIKVGRHWTQILFAVEGGRHGLGPFYRGGRHPVQSDVERLRFDLVDHDPERTPPRRTWRDDDGKRLEQQATEIVCGILLRVEEDARKWALWHHTSEIERRAREIREAKLAAEKAEADRIAYEKAAAAARIKQLIDGADALERAARIRRYVAAVRAENAAMPEPASSDALDAWAAWALAQADSIDPVASGRFLSNLNHQVAL